MALIYFKSFFILKIMICKTFQAILANKKTDINEFGKTFYVRTALDKNVKNADDEDGIQTHACRAHWISSPTP